MRLWILLIGAIALVGCGEGEVGDDCEENDDCEDSLVCDFGDPAAPSEEGTCQLPAGDDDDDAAGDDDDAADTAG